MIIYNAKPIYSAWNLRGCKQRGNKKAYRAKAKQYHPDFHPNDPKASEKMNEINLAYDMLQNPEKYANSNNNASANSNNGRTEERYRYQGSSNGQSTYGWSSDFSGFWFDDFSKITIFAAYKNTKYAMNAKTRFCKLLRIKQLY